MVRGVPNRLRLRRTCPCAADLAGARQFRPCGLGRAVLAILLLTAALASAAPPVIGLDEIRPGMTGYGLTVFRGARVDTFGVTVVGVQENVRAAGSLLLIEVSGHGLEHSSIAQGMSGSPIYLDGRFAGALAFGWSGSLSPIAGVTPAAEMLALPTAAPVPRRLAADGPALQDLLGQMGRADGLATALWDAPVAAPEAAAAATWPDAPELWQQLVSDLARDVPGWDPERAAWLFRPLGGAAGGSGGGGRLVPGGACAVPLVMGDAALGAIGTVTWVDGDRVLMMGHPFLQRGPVDLPLATAEILTILPSRDMSFKMGTIGDLVGAVHQDLRAGLAGRLGPSPALVPVTVRIENTDGADEVYSFEVADDLQLTPPLVFWSMYNALLVAGDDASLQTLEYRVTSRWDGPAAVSGAPLVVEGLTAGPGGAAGLGAEVMAPLAALLGNPHEPVRLRGVEAVFTRTRPLRTATITGLASPRAVVQAGEEIVFQAELTPREGERTTRAFAVSLPEHLPAGPYRVVVASAADLFALEAQRAPGRFQPRSLAGVLDVLRAPRSRSTLALALLAPGGAVVVQGREMAHLPESVARTVRAGNQQIPRTLADYVWRQDVRTDWVLEGHAVRNLRVRAVPSPLTDEGRP